MRNSITAFAAVAVVAAVAACDKKPEAVSKEPVKPSASVALTEGPPQPVPNATMTEVKGKVVEKLSLPTYSYLLLDTGKEKVWTAVPKADVEVGKEVTVEGATLMQSYRSASLNRTFDKVYFGKLRGAGPASGPGVPHGKAAAAPHGSGGGKPSAPAAPRIDVSKIKVAKAPGPDGQTVSEAISNVKKLAGKNVSVRGVVVKFNSGILDKNWIHLQDGTGKPADKNNDLAVTLPPDQKATIGETVIVHGKMLADHNLGSGYLYKALLQGKRLERSAKK